MRAFFVYTTTCIASTCSRAENDLVRGVGCHAFTRCLWKGMLPAQDRAAGTLACIPTA